MNSGAESYITSTGWRKRRIAEKPALPVTGELRAGFPEACFLLLIQHGLIHVAEVPGISVSSVSILHSDSVTLLERSELVQGKGECYGICRTIIAQAADVELLAPDLQDEKLSSGEKWTVARQG